jgi:FtsP/CotA-like multicopper oxidase with cupredoxin domain
MTRLIFAARIFIALVAAVLVTAQSPPPVPDNLKPPATEKLVRQARAEGDQVYTCDGSSWTLVAPDAKLFDEAGKQVGSHFAGPTWEWSDGSRVVGRPIANATPDPDSIPWLLLSATAHQGDGVMKQISSVQRLSTKGGKAPTTGCDQSHKSEKTRVHYTAVYYFYEVAR